MSEEKLTVQEELRILIDDIKKGVYSYPMPEPKFKGGDKLIKIRPDLLYPDIFIVSKADQSKYYRINDEGYEVWFYATQIDRIYIKMYYYNQIWNELNGTQI